MTNESPTKYAGDLVATLSTAVFHGSHTLTNVPVLVKRIISEKLWRSYQRGAEVANFDSFSDFIDRGLGTNVGTLQHLCRDDAGTLDALDLAIAGSPGSPRLNADNVNIIARPLGNSATKGIRRLRRSRPDLHGRVISGDLSAHQAMVEAGFRRKRFSVSADPERAAPSLRRRFTSEELNQLVTLLAEPTP